MRKMVLLGKREIVGIACIRTDR